jgi:hypothetical protein
MGTWGAGSQWCNRLLWIDEIHWPVFFRRKDEQDMSEQAKKVRSEAIPQWAEGLYYNKGLFSEALVYYDDEALYFEVRGKDSGIVRFSFEMIGTLKEVEEEQADSSPKK